MSLVRRKSLCIDTLVNGLNRMENMISFKR